jgi:ubiquinone/menaquinone biosynthesis C-methylase UbiE
MPISFDRLGLLFTLFSESFYSRQAKQHVSRFIRTVARGPVIDLGGGTGTLLDLAHRAKAHLVYVSVDPALGMLQYVPHYALRVAARSEEIPLGSATVGAVLIGDAMHHFQDLDRALGEIHRILMPEGRLFIFDIDPTTLLGRLVTGAERWMGEPGNFRSPRDLRKVLTRNGFLFLARGGGARYTVEAKKLALRS